jgi:hypothetical protein
MLINQQTPTAQAIGTWLRRLGKDNQGIKALSKINKTLLSDKKGVVIFLFSPNG